MAEPQVVCPGCNEAAKAIDCKQGRNAGRQFWVCPKDQGQQCIIGTKQDGSPKTFFQWLDQPAPQPAVKRTYGGSSTQQPYKAPRVDLPPPPAVNDQHLQLARQAVADCCDLRARLERIEKLLVDALAAK
jgi:GRF zinc finger protein